MTRNREPCWSGCSRTNRPVECLINDPVWSMTKGELAESIDKFLKAVLCTSSERAACHPTASSRKLERILRALKPNRNF
jgi:hypothetical protein